jgi:hypothetical protein
MVAHLAHSAAGYATVEATATIRTGDTDTSTG